MHPIRTWAVASAIAASNVQASKTSPVGSSPSVAKWSMFQTESNPASSAIRQTLRYSSIGARCVSLSPYRTTGVSHVDQPHLLLRPAALVAGRTVGGVGTVTAAVPRSLADDLRARSDDELAALLR